MSGTTDHAPTPPDPQEERLRRRLRIVVVFVLTGLLSIILLVFALAPLFGRNAAPTDDFVVYGILGTICFLVVGEIPAFLRRR